MGRAPRERPPAKKAVKTVDVVVKPKRAAKVKATAASEGRTVTRDFPISLENTATVESATPSPGSVIIVTNEQPRAGSAFEGLQVGGTAGSAFATPPEVPAPVRDAVNAMIDQVPGNARLDGSGSFAGDADILLFWRDDQLRDRQELARELRDLDHLLPEMATGIAAIISELRLATKPGGRLNNQKQEVEAEIEALEAIPSEISAVSTSLREQVESEQPSRATVKTAGFLFGRVKDQLAKLRLRDFLWMGAAIPGGLDWPDVVLGKIEHVVVHIHNLF
jgi:hypothetical protein